VKQLVNPYIIFDLANIFRYTHEPNKVMLDERIYEIKCLYPGYFGDNRTTFKPGRYNPYLLLDLPLFTFENGIETFIEKLLKHGYNVTNLFDIFEICKTQNILDGCFKLYNMIYDTMYKDQNPKPIRYIDFITQCESLEAEIFQILKANLYEVNVRVKTKVEQINILTLHILDMCIKKIKKN
jgi:hypothetical protein